METTKISRKLLNRLPAYLDYLRTLPEDSSNISATAIARALGLGEVQVRKDLAKVAHEGRCRTGRSRKQLIWDIEQYLAFAATTGTVVVGAGKLGQALLDYTGFEESGLNVLAGFDLNPAQKQTRSGKPIYPMHRLEPFCRCYDVRIGIIAVPEKNAQSVCDCLIACGVQAIWNFAPVQLKVPPYVVVQSEDLSLSLTALKNELRDRLAVS